MRSKTAAENAHAIKLASEGRKPADIAASLGVTVDTLYQRGRRDPELGEALALVKRKRRTPELERRLREMWPLTDRYRVVDIAEALGISRATVHEWANDLGLKRGLRRCGQRPLEHGLRGVRKSNRNPKKSPTPRVKHVPRTPAAIARKLGISVEAAERLLEAVGPQDQP
ncbi:terminase gpP N-terminus-related DNA-binding protein [Glycomyces tarimensis]